jgi:hypothetical protein
LRDDGGGFHVRELGETAGIVVGHTTQIFNASMDYKDELFPCDPFL